MSINEHVISGLRHFKITADRYEKTINGKPDRNALLEQQAKKVSNNR